MPYGSRLVSLRVTLAPTAGGQTSHRGFWGGDGGKNPKRLSRRASLASLRCLPLFTTSRFPGLLLLHVGQNKIHQPEEINVTCKAWAFFN